MISEAVIITLITTAGAILVAYITYRVKNSKPKTDRVDTAFDMYEKLLKRANEENGQLRTEIRELKAQLRDR